MPIYTRLFFSLEKYGRRRLETIRAAQSILTAADEDDRAEGEGGGGGGQRAVLRGSGGSDGLFVGRWWGSISPFGIGRMEVVGSVHLL